MMKEQQNTYKLHRDVQLYLNGGLCEHCRHRSSCTDQHVHAYVITCAQYEEGDVNADKGTIL